MGCYGYPRPTTPAIDELAKGAVRFANARSTSSWTLPSVASMMTGLYPAVHGAEHSDSVLSSELGTLARDFQTNGYETAAISANTAFVTPGHGLAEGFGRFDLLSAPPDSGAQNATAEEVTDAALDWLTSRDQSKPFFLYLHYYDPHAGYWPPEAFARRFGVDPGSPLAGLKQWTILLSGVVPPAWQLETFVSLYDAEIAATDSAIGRLLGEFSSRLRGATYVAVTSDHGEEFGEHGGMQHGRTLYDELLRVPLVVSGPGLPGGTVVPSPVSLVSLRATLIDLAGLPRDSGGARSSPSLVPFVSTSRKVIRPVYADLEKRDAADLLLHRRSMILGDRKLLVDPADGEQFFDLATDAGELHATEKASPAVKDAWSRMRLELRARDEAAADTRMESPPGRLVLDKPEREHLKALGYLQ